jgi:hypothetical protein
MLLIRCKISRSFKRNINGLQLDYRSLTKGSFNCLPTIHGPGARLFARLDVSGVEAISSWTTAALNQLSWLRDRSGCLGLRYAL